MAQAAIRATEILADWIADPSTDPITDAARTRATHAVLDWAACTVAGTREEAPSLLIKGVDAGPVPLFGRTERSSPAFAALINGTASHALDLDDVNTRMRGHPSVAVLPALLAATEADTCSGRQLLDALVAGTETACIVGEMLGDEHYERGFHTTATVGTIAAAAGCARLLGLNGPTTQHALGIAASSAAGLRASFGTMTKPLHAGRAAMNGYLAASWAVAGLTASSDILEAPQGFGATQSSAFRPLPVRSDRSQPFGIEQNLFKLHAACYYAHSAIEAMQHLVAAHDLETHDMSVVRVGVEPSVLTVCDIREPETGLEVKFSLRHLVAMAALGVDTGDVAVYSSETARRADLIDLRSRVAVDRDEGLFRTAAKVQIECLDGRRLEHEIDVGQPTKDADTQWQQLSNKAKALMAPHLGADRALGLVEVVAQLERADDARALSRAADPNSEEAGNGRQVRVG